MKPNSGRHILWLVILLLAAVAVTVQMLTVAVHTLVPLWGVVAISAGAAAGLYLPLRRMWSRLVGGNPWAALAVSVLVVAPVLSSAVLNINYYGADFATMPLVQAVVVDKSVKERPVMRRVTRRTYVRSGSRKVYEVSIDIGGCSLTMEESYERYRTLRTGSAVSVRCGRGALGLRVVRFCK